MSSTTGSQGRGVVVTGAGSGIGRATALRFAQLGDKVLVADLNADGAEAVVKEIEAGGGTARAVVGDLSDQHTADEVISTAVEAFGGLDVLVNNAGIIDTMTATADVSDAKWERVIRINLTAPFLLTRAALPHLLGRGNGAIVNTASEAALRGSAAGTAYTVSKHGIISTAPVSRSPPTSPRRPRWWRPRTWGRPERTSRTSKPCTPSTGSPRPTPAARPATPGASSSSRSEHAARPRRSAPPYSTRSPPTPRPPPSPTTSPRPRQSHSSNCSGLETQTLVIAH